MVLRSLQDTNGVAGDVRSRAFLTQEARVTFLASEGVESANSRLFETLRARKNNQRAPGRPRNEARNRSGTGPAGRSPHRERRLPRRPVASLKSSPRLGLERAAVTTGGVQGLKTISTRIAKTTASEQ
jgi:hypothetical protein